MNTPIMKMKENNQDIVNVSHIEIKRTVVVQQSATDHLQITSCATSADKCLMQP